MMDYIHGLTVSNPTLNVGGQCLTPGNVTSDSRKNDIQVANLPDPWQTVVMLQYDSNAHMLISFFKISEPQNE